MKCLSLALCSIVIVLALGGCRYQMRSGSLGYARVGNKAQTLALGPTIEIVPDYTIVFTNRTDLFADIYIGAELVYKDLGPGQIMSYGLVDFFVEETIVVTVVCHKGDVLVGFVSDYFSLLKRRAPIQWEFQIERVDLIEIYGDFTEDEVISILPPQGSM